MSIQIQQSFSTIQLDQLRHLCDKSYEGKIYCEESGEFKENEHTSDHKITNFRIYYSGPTNSDPHHGIEGMRINVEGICYKRRTSPTVARGVEFNFDGALYTERDLENDEYFFGPHVKDYESFQAHVSATNPNECLPRSRDDWKWRYDIRSHLTDPVNVIPYCPMCSMLPTDEQLLKSAKKEKYKSESALREILEELFATQFPNKRPFWLKSPQTGARLELDCYSQELGVAFEYQGAQHYGPVSFFGGAPCFEAQKERDEYKRQICKDRGVTLIEVDGRTYNHNNKKAMKSHVKDLLKEVKIVLDKC